MTELARRPAVAAPVRSRRKLRPATYAGSVHRLQAWLRDRPWRAEFLLAGLVLAVSADQWGGDRAIEVVSIALAITVAVRRRYPVLAFAVAAVIGTMQVTLGLQLHGTPQIAAFQPTASDLAIAVLLYTLAAHCSRRVSVAGLASCFALTGLAIARWTPVAGQHPQGPLLGAAIGLGGTALIAWVLGDSVAYRHRLAYYASLEDRAARLEAERDAQARIAAAAERARELQERRALAVDESAARLRQIERDLHDGAQVRLAALAMTLGEAKESLEAATDGEEDGGRTRMLVVAAHRNAKETLTELRDLARGIHPAVLDRGLGAALTALSETSPIPVELHVAVSARPSPAIETIAYFCTAELLANAVKHSCAEHVLISLTDSDGSLRMLVTDDGTGGARISAGGGLAGLVERVQTVDGSLSVSSPAGGPTVISVGLPVHA
jgi:signal transduction histidine kinase